ncbi:MAG TPA: TetR/AcrR family transcriptional regulator [Yinghuangia sp.]|uniref:TetR/AcrR family transcriptional regulator n=1 Tax=Yinghuangia sp. YIM S10712 TaxID=3436930 RepID=UPI002C3E02F3|nr:TetR/AcrR family transcriptional regulator [Yinghuangia sp.]
MSGKQRGRPRSDQAHQAILESARDLLTSGGYERMTMDAIAARAGVGKQTVYRWWPSKAAVVAEAVLAGYLVAEGGAPGDTGDVEADLRAWVRAIFGQLDDPANTALIRGLAAAAADRESDALRLYRRLTGPAREHLVARLAAGVREGQLRPDADLEAAADAVVGTLLYRALAHSPEAVRPEEADGLCDLLFLGLRRPAGTKT